MVGTLVCLIKPCRSLLPSKLGVPNKSHPSLRALFISLSKLRLSDITNLNYLDIKKIKSLNAGKINFIFLNGAIHHFNDKIINDLLNYINKKFPKAIFLSIDPLRANNNFINKFMINNDRGKFIRNKKQYKKIMGKFSKLVTKDFFIIKFLLIFHYKNIDLKKKFTQWKKK